MKINKIKEQSLMPSCLSADKVGHLPFHPFGGQVKKGEVLKKQGFTLVELLIVISIIGILTVITAGSFLESQKKSRDGARKANLKSLSDSLNLFYADNGSFPDDGTGAKSIPTLIGNELEFSVTDSSGKKIVYMKRLPKEKTSMKQILYDVSPTAKSFRLYTNLENDQDKDCIDKSVCSNSLGYIVTSGCCYIVTSSNIGISGNWQ